MIASSLLLTFGTAALTLSIPSPVERDVDWAISSLNALEAFYNTTSGLWGDAWWQSANTLTAVADLHAVDSSIGQTASFFYETTYNNAPGASNSPGFINDFYDDEGWWAMAWIRVFDVTGDQKYLTLAQSIFNDMQSGLGAPCNGGYWWDKQHTYVASISNELFIAVGASLANRIPAQKDQYLSLAMDRWSWLVNSGVFTGQGTIQDGLETSTCQPNDQVWTYNQGVILGGLCALNQATGDGSHIWEANNIASATMSELSTNGILNEQCDPGCEGDTSAMFKGVFIRNLANLVVCQSSPPSNIKDFVVNNANSVWNNAQTSNGLFSAVWNSSGGLADYVSTSAGADALIAGVVVGA